MEESFALHFRSSKYVWIITISKSKRRERLEKVAGNRVNIIIKTLDSLEKCSNKNNYDYSDEDIRKMERALRDKMNTVLKSFSNEINKKRNVEFKF